MTSRRSEHRRRGNGRRSGDGICHRAALVQLLTDCERLKATPAPRPPYEAANPVAAAVWRACIEELDAPKPGNVSFASAGVLVAA